ncbi:hypothetical protein SDC9_190344 [bioreactor metagenome]|uniref:Uncharacterized protein n=1 Tax=bioreactor metagenome TaxID=1076179 RepID=A0A645HW34_9ZZZZ
MARAIQPAAHTDQLRRALGFPGVLLLAHELHTHGLAGELGDQRGIGAHVVRAIAAITARGLHAQNVHRIGVQLQQLGDVLAQIVRVPRAGPHLHLAVSHARHRT